MAEEDDLKVQSVDTEHAYIRAGVSDNNWLFSLFSADNIDLDDLDYPNIALVYLLYSCVTSQS